MTGIGGLIPRVAAVAGAAAAPTRLRRLASRHYMPGEVPAAEGVHGPVAGDSAGSVLAERVERVALVGDLLRPVGAVDHAELAREGARRGVAHGRRHPDGGAG